MITIDENSKISLAVVAMSIGSIIGAAVYITTIHGIATANASEIVKNKTAVESFRRAYIEHSRIVDKNFSDVNESLGELKGMVKVLLEDRKR